MKLEQAKSQYPIQIMIQGVKTPLLATVQYSTRVKKMEIVDLVLRASNVDYHVLSLILDETIYNEAIYQMQNQIEQERIS
jgi:hypothetical protein